MSQTILGTDVLTDEQVAMDTELRQRSMYVVGIQGGGKSSFLQTLIHQDIMAGSSVIVIDPHEDLLYDVIAQLPQDKLEKTYFLDLSDRDFPFGLNIFSCANHKDDEQRDITRNRVAHMFERIWPETQGGRYFGTLLENVIDTLIENPGTTMADIPHLLQDELFRGRCIRGLQNQEVKAYWRDDYNKKSASVQQKERDPLVSRVRELLRQTPVKNIICQRHTTFDFRRSIENKEIILINLPLRNPAYEKSAPIVGIMLLSEICRAVFSFSDIRDKEKRPRFSLFVDEYQNFTTSDFSKLFTEGRKFGIRTTVAHQERSQLDETNKNASHTAFTKVAFQTTNKDATELADYFRAKDTWVRPENVYPDVLNHLKDHPNPDVAAFFETYIQPLQNVAKEKIKHYRDEEVRPKLVVGDKTFTIDPEWAIQQLEEFRKSLYAVSCGEEFEWPNYYRIVKWWDFRLACTKRFESAPPIHEVTLGWQMDCSEKPFDKDASFVSVLRQFGKIATWTPVDDTAGMYQAVVNESIGKKWSEKVEIALLLVRMREDEQAFRTVVFHRHKQNRPMTFLETYHKGTLTSAFLQSVVRQEGSPPTKKDISCISLARCLLSKDYKDIYAYLDSIRDAQKKKVMPFIPDAPRVNQTVRFLWWSYVRKLTRAEQQACAAYRETLNERYSYTTSAPDRPRELIASLAQWAEAFRGSYETYLDFLGRATKDTTYVLSAITDINHAKKVLGEYCKQWYAYTNDITSYVQTDLQATYDEVCEEMRNLKAQLDAQRQEIATRIQQRLATEEDRLTQFYTRFLATVDELQKRPLGVLKTPSSTEMKESILSLKPRQAYVRIGAAVHHIHTLDVPEKVGKRELACRVSFIRELTHRNYCQERSLVEKEFRTIERDDEAEPHNTLPGNDGKNPTSHVFQAFEELDEG